MSPYAIYLPIGLLQTSTNILVILTVLRSPHLRSLKEYTIICALALSDALAGTANIISAIYRVRIIMDGLEEEKTSRFACYFAPHNLFYGHSYLLQPLMLLAVSIDRYLAISIPLRYYGFTHTYACWLVGSFYALAFGNQILGFMLVQNSKANEVPILCFSVDGLAPGHFQFNFISQILFTIVSILLYVNVMIIYKRKEKAQNGIIFGGTIQAEQNKRFTRSMGYSCIFTFFFYVLPTVCMLLVKVVEGPRLLGGTAYILSQLNPVFNLFIFLKCHKEFRNGLVAMIKCKSVAQQNIVVAPLHTGDGEQHVARRAF